MTLAPELGELLRKERWLGRKEGSRSIAVEFSGSPTWTLKEITQHYEY